MAIGIGTASASASAVGGLGLGLSNTTYKPGDILNQVGKGLADFGNNVKDSFLAEDTPPELKLILNNGGWRHYASANGIPQSRDAVIEHYMNNYNKKENKPNDNEKEDNNSNNNSNKTPSITPTPNGTEEENKGTVTPEDEQQGNVDNEFKQMLELANQEKYENWEREDQIRKETQKREDSAWQRMVKDMRNAGINPNLINATPSASGGGITNATQRESIIGNEIATISNELINAIKNDTTVTNNWKDNAFKTVQSFISLIGTYFIGKNLKK